jgi:hypothetical protein
MHQVVSSMSQAATTGAAGAGANVATAGTAGAGANVATAGGATTGATAGGLGAGLTTLRGGPGLIRTLLFTTTTGGFNGRPTRTRLEMRGRPTGRFTSTFCGSASTTQARATRARSTCRTESKILV